MTPIPLQKLHGIFDSLAHVQYGLGDKAAMSEPASSIRTIDCSGVVRYALSNATNGVVKIPDGSWYQRQWCERNLKEVPYATVAGAGADRLFIAFMTAGVNGVGRTGHVWLIHDGKTLESYNGRGVGSRHWDTQVLLKGVHKCFELPTEAIKLVVIPHNEIVDQAYLAGGKWRSTTGALAVIVGGTTQDPNRMVDVRQQLDAWGWEIIKYTDAIEEKNRAYIRIARK